MAFSSGPSRPLQGRGGSPGFRFTLYAIVSIVIMVLDQRLGYLEQARYLLQGAAYPVQLAVSSPAKALTWLEQNMQARDVLEAENQRLRNRELELELRSMRFEALAKENGELRGLRDALPPVADRWLVAEIVNVELDSLRQRVLLNRGANNGLFKGQAVIDDEGVLGQTTHVGPWSAEVMLITDPEHAIPVEIERTGVKTIAVGVGDKSTPLLALPDLPANADIKVGDRLVTSGLGGVFPQGYPVAKVTEIHRDAQPVVFRATPYARIATDREVVLVWFRPGHPAAPGPATDEDLPSGNAAFQPQPVPKKPRKASRSTHAPTAAHETARHHRSAATVSSSSHHLTRRSPTPAASARSAQQGRP